MAFEEKNYWKRLPRRRVLQGAAFGAVGAVGLAAVGCGDDDNKSTPAPSSSTTAATTAAGGSATAAKPSAAAGLPDVAGLTWLQNKPNPSLTPKPGGTLHYGTYLRAASLDPIKSATFESAQVYTQVYSRLFRAKYGSEMTNYSPWSYEQTTDLAASLEQPSAGSYVIKLKPGTKWSPVAPVNGRAFTADDVKFTLETFGASPEFKAGWLPIDSVTVTDPTTVQVKLSKPVNYLMQALSECRIVMLPKEVAAADGDFSKRAVGTGPFMLDQYTPNTSASYKKNPNYYVPNRPYLDGIVYEVYADLATAQANYLAGKFQVGRGDGITEATNYKNILSARKDDVAFQWNRWQTSVFHLAFRADKAPGNDPRIVTAMSKAFDRQNFAKQTFNGLPGQVLGPYPWADYFPSEPDLGDAYKFDIAGAKALLSAAGVTGTMEVTMEYANYGQSLVDQIQAFAASLQAIGVKMNLMMEDIPTYSKNYSTGGIQQGTFGFIATTPRFAPISAITNFYSTSPRNAYFLKDKDIDGALDKVTQSLDNNEVKSNFQTFYKKLMTTPYILSNIEGPSTYVFSSKVHNWLFNEYNDWTAWGNQSFDNVWIDA